MKYSLKLCGLFALRISAVKYIYTETATPGQSARARSDDRNVPGGTFYLI